MILFEGIFFNYRCNERKCDFLSKKLENNTKKILIKIRETFCSIYIDESFLFILRSDFYLVFLRNIFYTEFEEIKGNMISATFRSCS